MSRTRLLHSPLSQVPIEGISPTFVILWKLGPDECRDELATSHARPTTSCYRHPRWRVTLKRSPLAATLATVLRCLCHLNNHCFDIEHHKHTFKKYYLATWYFCVASLAFPLRAAPPPRLKRHRAAGPRNLHVDYTALPFRIYNFAARKFSSKTVQWTFRKLRKRVVKLKKLCVTQGILGECV